MTILDQLADHARERVSQAKLKCPPEELRRQAEALPRGDFRFERALRKGREAGETAPESFGVSGGQKLLQ